MRKSINEGVSFNKIAEKVVAIIKGKGHSVILFTDDGMETSNPEDARRFYVKQPNYMITIDSENGLLRINKNSKVKLDEIEGILKQVRQLARNYMLNTELKVFGKTITPKDFAYQAKKYRKDRMNTIGEASLSRMHGSKKTSYQTLESTKIIVRHRKPVDEEMRGSRSRQIKEIFIEKAGERFRFPYNNLAGARAMARHIDEGGAIYDEVGQYIVESVGNLKKLIEFLSYSRRNKLINEESEDIIKIVRENISAYRRELQKLQGVKSYKSMCEQISNRQGSEIDEDGTDDLQSMFTVRKFDEKISETLPLIKRLITEKNAWRSRIEEASTNNFVVTSTEDLIEGDVIEFDSPIQKLGYKIRALAERVTEESELSQFVAKTAKKLSEGEQLSRFEKSVISNVLGNVTVAEEESIEHVDALEEICENIDRRLKALEYIQWDKIDEQKKGRIRKAEIVDIKPNYTDKDDWGYPQKYRGYTTVVDDTGEKHYFYIGAVNQIRDAEVGDKGTIEYQTGPNYGTFFWTKDEVNEEGEYPLADQEYTDLQYRQDRCPHCDTPYDTKFQICPRSTCPSHEE